MRRVVILAITVVTALAVAAPAHAGLSITNNLKSPSPSFSDPGTYNIQIGGGGNI